MLILDPIFLARLQFAFTVSFHIVFPAFSIGLASFLAVLEWLWLRTNDPNYRDTYKFLVKIFAVVFGMGVVSGVVMSYEFGTNWSVFSDKISNVIGPLLGFEVLTAFFLEASFLGIMLFGWNRVSSKMHFTSTCIVAFGTVLSAFWILSANSWMQTPQGFTVGDDGRLFASSWLEIIFNPSFPYRFFHMLTAAYLTTALVVGGIGAYYLWNKRHLPHAKIMLVMATLMVSLTSPIQIILGDLHGLNTLIYQPAKIAAIEGIWETEQGAGLRLFAVPDSKNEINHYELSIPYLSSLILTHHFSGTVQGLKSFAKEDRPPVGIVFFAFRIMVALGFAMLFLSLISLIQYFRKKLFSNRMILAYWILMMPSVFIALLSGWFVTEVGRQPFTVYGFIRTVESVSPGVMGRELVWSLLAFVLMYAFVFGASTYYILKLIRKGIPIIKDEELYYKHGNKASLIEELTKPEPDHV